MNMVILLLVLTLFSATLCAQDYRPSEAAHKTAPGRVLAVGTEFLYADDAFYIGIIPHVQWKEKSFRFTLQKPIRFLVFDDTDTVPTKATVFPEEEWNDVRDFVEIAHRIEYGNSGDTVHVSFSEVSDVTFGQSTPFSDYRNDILFQYPRRATRIDLLFPAIRTHFFVNDVVKPEVLGARVSVQPFVFANKKSYAGNLTVGFTFGGDITAPETGGLVDSDGSLHYRERFVGMYETDIAFRLLALQHYHLTLYSQITPSSYGSLGGATGISHKLLLHGKHAIVIRNTAEYRIFGAGYEPDYFDEFYDVQRFVFRQNASKLTTVLQRQQLESATPFSGLKCTLGVDIDEMLSFSFRYRWREKGTVSGKARHDISVRADVRTPRFDFSLTFIKNGEQGESFFTDKNNNFLLDTFARFYIIRDILAVKLAGQTSWTRTQQTIGGRTVVQPDAHIDFAATVWGELRFK